MDVKGILIDSAAKTITEVTIKDYDYKKIYPLIGAETFDIVGLGDSDENGNSETLYVDGDGLLKNPETFFEIKGYHSPLAGKGLILGSDDEGDTISTEFTLDFIKSVISFPDGVKFEGFDPIPEGTRVDHPVLGNVPVLGEVPKFSRGD